MNQELFNPIYGNAQSAEAWIKKQRLNKDNPPDLASRNIRWDLLSSSRPIVTGDAGRDWKDETQNEKEKRLAEAESFFQKHGLQDLPSDKPPVSLPDPVEEPAEKAQPLPPAPQMESREQPGGWSDQPPWGDVWTEENERRQLEPDLPSDKPPVSLGPPLPDDAKLPPATDELIRQRIEDRATEASRMMEAQRESVALHDELKLSDDLDSWNPRDELKSMEAQQEAMRGNLDAPSEVRQPAPPSTAAQWEAGNRVPFRADQPVALPDQPQPAPLQPQPQPAAVDAAQVAPDPSNAEFREWWSEVVAAAHRDAPLDGVFVDALPQALSPAIGRQGGKDEEIVRLLTNISEGIDTLNRAVEGITEAVKQATEKIDEIGTFGP